MPIDRNATIKQAQKLLRLGKLDGAIELFVRLVDDQPEDWNAVNVLGDLYLRAGNNARAAEQFTRVADHQFSEGFLPKASALYKKALKVKPADEHILMQLAGIAERQGKFADAKLFLQQIAKQRRSRGEQRSAAECILRLGSLDGADVESKIAASLAAQQIGDAFRAVELLKEAADALDKENRRSEAVQLLADASEIDPFDTELRHQLAQEFIAAGQPNRARAYLSAETAGDDPDLLLALATIEFADAKETEARTAIMRLLALAPDREADVMRLADELIGGGRVESAFACIDAITDAALLSGQLPRAAALLQTFVAQAPHIPALMKLVEISVDADMQQTLRQAQGQLAEAYLVASHAEEARVIAEDLLRTEPGNKAHADRLRRALVLLGVDNPDAVVAQARGGASADIPDDPFAMTDAELVELAPAVELDVPTPDIETFVYPGPGPGPSDVDLSVPDVTTLDFEMSSLGIPLTPATPEHDVAPEPPIGNESEDDGAAVLETTEVDLSTALSGLISAPVPPAPVKAETAPAPAEPAPDIEEVFAQMRAKNAREQQASAALGQYEQALQYLEQGLVGEAITALQSAARIPLLRFKAAAQLGRMLIDRGDLNEGVEWLERAAEAPAPTPEEGYALLYELAGALEAQGESARTLAILMELDAETDGYRDVRNRIVQLSRAQTGSPRS